MIKKAGFVSLLVILIFVCNIAVLPAETQEVQKIQETQNAQQDVDLFENAWQVLVTCEAPQYGSWGPIEIKWFTGSAEVINPMDPAFEGKILRYNIITMKENWNPRNSYWLTNWHMVTTRGKILSIELIKAKPAYGTEPEQAERLKATVVAKDPINDLAILEVPNVKFTPIKIGDVNKIDFEYYQNNEFDGGYGYPALRSGFGHRIKSASKVRVYDIIDVYNNFTRYFDAIIDTKENPDYIFFKGDSGPGDSGSPIRGLEGYNKNKLIGVVARGIPGSNKGFAIPSYVLKEAIPRLFAKNVHYPYYTGLVLTRPSAVKDEKNYNFFKSLKFPGVYYRVLQQKDGALIIGFQEDSKLKGQILHGDVITHLNNIPIKDHYDFVRKLKKIDDPQLEIKLLRFTKDENSTWKREEIVITKTKDELTVSEDDLLKSYTEKGYPVIQAEIRGKVVKFNPYVTFLSDVDDVNNEE